MSEAHALDPALLAPWAETAPGAGPMALSQLAALPDDGWCYELVAGDLVRIS